MNKKAFTYIGFAIKAKKIIYGGDNIIRAFKVCKLIIMSENINRTTAYKINKNAEKYMVPVLNISTDEIFEYISRDNTKVFAITDKNLAEAVRENI